MTQKFQGVALPGRVDGSDDEEDHEHDESERKGGETSALHEEPEDMCDNSASDEQAYTRLFDTGLFLSHLVGDFSAFPVGLLG